MDGIRWVQRFSNFKKALGHLEAALEQQSFSDLELQGPIKGFELCYELAWKTLQDILRARGLEDVAGPKPVLRQAFKDGLIRDGELWSAMHEARKLVAHTYDLARARSLAGGIGRGSRGVGR
jgi:nucleotidyltransferase substrate binding protein (TIGR01987 family)